MKVYIVTEEPYHENSTILKVFTDLDKALEYMENDLEATRKDGERYLIENWGCVAVRNVRTTSYCGIYNYLVWEREVC